MAVRIRLKRTGRRNRPFYRICAFDSRTRRDGRPIEELGSYDPHGASLEQKVWLNAERALHWLDTGALPTETVASIFRRVGVAKGKPAPDNVMTRSRQDQDDLDPAVEPAPEPVTEPVTEGASAEVAAATEEAAAPTADAPATADAGTPDEEPAANAAATDETTEQVSDAPAKDEASS